MAKFVTSSVVKSFIYATYRKVSKSFYFVNKTTSKDDMCSIEIKQNTRLTYNCAHLRSTKENYGTGWFLVILGQYGAVLVGTWWYWVSNSL